MVTTRDREPRVPEVSGSSSSRCYDSMRLDRLHGVHPSLHPFGGSTLVADPELLLRPADTHRAVLV